jgi:hypothetical protein
MVDPKEYLALTLKVGSLRAGLNRRHFQRHIVPSLRSRLLPLEDYRTMSIFRASYLNETTSLGLSWTSGAS